jgi:hypothetical protein
MSHVAHSAVQPSPLPFCCPTGSSGPGCAKFLDEYLVWRELAYAFAFHR